MRFLLTIVAIVVVAYGIGFYLTVPANPEVRFWREVVERRETELTQVRKQQPDAPVLIFTGGSSCAFSIDPAIIERTCGLPAFNLGLPVSAGRQYLVHQALAQTRKGDILVVCLEPDALTFANHDSSSSKLSFALSATAGHPSEAAGGETYGEKPAVRDYLNLSRPGPGYLATFAAKAIAGKGYRYTAEDLRYHGRVETPVTNDDMPAAGDNTATGLAPDGSEFLKTLVHASARRGVRVVYAMPWHYTASSSIAHNRQNNLKILADIRSILPVIDDGFAGAADNRGWFSDSPQHLTAAGSSVRSTAVADALKQLPATK